MVAVILADQTSGTTVRTVPQAVPTHSYGWEWIVFVVLVVILAAILLVVRSARAGRRG